MSIPQVAVDRELIEDSFREWQEEQSQFDAQLAESVEALAAYQSHLDNWQQELAHERDELRQLREALEQDRAAGGGGEQQIELLDKELGELREKVSSLTTALLARTEELREQDRRRESVAAELEKSHLREKELAAALAAQQHASGTRRKPGEDHNDHQHDDADKSADQAPADPQGDSAQSGTARVEPRRSASPVLGSVMEQFGKLREQRSMNRSNNKTR
jgi:septal ring factor EnvC (AmiA/AmiB activator)